MYMYTSHYLHTVYMHIICYCTTCGTIYSNCNSTLSTDSYVLHKHTRLHAAQAPTTWHLYCTPCHSHCHSYIAPVLYTMPLPLPLPHGTCTVHHATHTATPTSHLYCTPCHSHCHSHMAPVLYTMPLPLPLPLPHTHLHTQEPSLYQSLPEWTSAPPDREVLCREVWHFSPNIHTPQQELTSTLMATIDNFGQVSPTTGGWHVPCVLVNVSSQLPCYADVCTNREAETCPSLLSAPS